jgi:hypothetical protein
MNGVTTDWAGNVRPPAPRTFSSFSQAARENADSRIYLGIHWQFDADQGLIQGTKVADWVFTHFATHRPHPLLHQLVHVVDAFGIATHRLFDRLSDIIDRVFATTNFQPLAASAVPLVGKPAAPASAIASAPTATIAKSSAGVSLEFVNAGLAQSASQPAAAAKSLGGVATVKVKR